MAILSRCQAGKWALVSSEAVELELNKTRDNDKLKKIFALLSMAEEKLKLNEAVVSRSLEFQKNGIKPMDSLHLAVAEISKVDVLLTTDDVFLRNTIRMNLNITVANPVTWYMEVMRNEWQHGN
ncbi:MAG: PIN domain-containing protein [Clostridiales Family XIII bacterium]|nr:PIN domain-containing protein [Clostridiales Family XIII bacterium]